jgi:hypothetical protein
LCQKFDTTKRGTFDFPTFLFMVAHLAHCRSIFEVRTGESVDLTPLVERYYQDWSNSFNLRQFVPHWYRSFIFLVENKRPFFSIPVTRKKISRCHHSVMAGFCWVLLSFLAVGLCNVHLSKEDLHRNAPPTPNITKICYACLPGKLH